MRPIMIAQGTPWTGHGFSDCDTRIARRAGLPVIDPADKAEAQPDCRLPTALPSSQAGLS